jgi:hypothetical protein
MPYVRIVRTPVGVAPLEIREQWIGLLLPLALPMRVKPAVAAVLTHNKETTTGYLVNAEIAVQILATKSPDAAQWWRENYVRRSIPGTNLLFDAACCRLEADPPRDKRPESGMPSTKASTF